MKIVDLIEFQKKSNLKANQISLNGSFPFFTSSPKQSKLIDTAQHSVPSLIFGTGGNPSIHYCEEPFSTSTDCLVGYLRKDKLNTYKLKYIYLYIYGNMGLLEKGFKGAGLKHISKSYISEINIPEISLTEQEKIVEKLENIIELKKIRMDSILLLDSYLKSKYLELFPVNNKMPITTIEHLAENKKGSIRTGPFGSDLKHSEFVEEGVAVIGIDNAVTNRFRWDKRRYITEKKYEKLKRYTVNPRDVIVTIMGTTGRSAVIPDDIPTAINTKHLVAMTFDANRANPYFIAFALQFDPRLKAQMSKQTKGAIMDGLNSTIIKNLNIPKWPIESQNTFELIYQNVILLKDKMDDQLSEIEDLFSSSSIKGFSGSL